MAGMMIIFVAYLMVAAFALVAGIDMVVPDILDKDGIFDGVPLRLYAIVDVSLVVLSGYNLLGYYLFLIVAILASSTWILFTSYQGFGKELTMKATSRDHSPLFDVAGLLFATMLFSVIMGLAFGGSDGVDFDRFSLSELLFLLANASVWEEIAFRVVLLGLPLLVIDFIRRKDGRKIHSYFLGGGFTFGAVEVVLVIVSSAIFGYAHYDGGWGAWKIVAAGAGGAAMAYLFLKHGLA